MEIKKVCAQHKKEIGQEGDLVFEASEFSRLSFYLL